MNARSKNYDAVIVGAGPNGFAAAITLARAGKSVLLLEAADQLGGGIRSAELTLPGFIHDPCATVLSLTQLSPFFHTLSLRDLGVEFVLPPAPLAHPLDDGTAILANLSVDVTAANLGRDANAYRRVMGVLLDNADKIIPQVLGPLNISPRHPLALAWFGWHAIRSARGLAQSLFKEERARALFAGFSAHAIQPLENLPTAAFGLLLAASAHASGWPLVRGGSQKLADALATYARGLGVEIIANTCVDSFADLPDARAYIFNTSPAALDRIAGERLTNGYRNALKKYRYGAGVFKMDWALDAPIPWRARECLSAGTVHLGGTLEEIAASESAVGRGEHPEKPFVLLVQATLFDPTRAPEGKHTAWAYCHVPNGSTFDMTDRIEAQIERFAPGFRNRILARSVMPPRAMQIHDANYVGGDINVGVQDLFQLFTRPTIQLDPYSTSARDIFLCSSATPPGGGVHGMSGFYAAKSALRRWRP